MADSPDTGLSRAEIEALYLRLERRVFNIVYRWVWDWEESQDLVQESFLKLWRMRERVRCETVEPLVYRIAVNLAANRRRSRRLWRWTGLALVRDRAGCEARIADDLERREERRAVRCAIEALPNHLRQVILMCEYSELSYAEIGTALGIPAGTVGSRRNAALKRLRKSLKSIKGD